MTLSTEDRTDIKALVCDIIELDADEVSNSSQFVDDHGADSLLAIEILSAIEKKYKVRIDQTELPRMGNMDGVYTVIEEAQQKVSP